MLPFEGFNQSIIGYCKGPTHVAMQVFKRFPSIRMVEIKRHRHPRETQDMVLGHPCADTFISKRLKRERKNEGVERSVEGIVFSGASVETSFLCVKEGSSRLWLGLNMCLDVHFVVFSENDQMQ